MTDFAFAVTYGCRNCGNEWTDEFPERTIVTEQLDRVHVTDKDCDEFGSCGCCNSVTCPCCGLKKRVYVTDREPIEEDHEGVGGGA